MTEKSVFREAWSSELMSQSFPVSCFWCQGFVPHRKWNLTLMAHENTGKENCYLKNFSATLISTLGRFNRANRKKSVIYTLKSFSLHLCLLNFLSPFRSLYARECKVSSNCSFTPSCCLEPSSLTAHQLGVGFHSNCPSTDPSVGPPPSLQGPLHWCLDPFAFQPNPISPYRVAEQTLIGVNLWLTEVNVWEHSLGLNQHKWRSAFARCRHADTYLLQFAVCFGMLFVSCSCPLFPLPQLIVSLAPPFFCFLFYFVLCSSTGFGQVWLCKGHP